MAALNLLASPAQHQMRIGSPPSTFRFSDLVTLPRSRELCNEILTMVRTLLLNELFIEALSDISVITYKKFRMVSNEGARFFRDGKWHDLEVVSSCTLLQLCWYCAKDPRYRLEALIHLDRAADRYNALQDKHYPSLHSVKMKARVVEYAVALSRYTGPAISEHRRKKALDLQSLLIEWHGLFFDFLKIVAGHWDRVPLPLSLPAPRNMAQLIGLSTVAEKMQETNPTCFDRAYQAYARVIQL